MKGLPVTQETQDLLLEVLTKQYAYMMSLHKAATSDNMFAKEMALAASMKTLRDYEAAGKRLQEEYVKCSLERNSVPVSMSKSQPQSEVIDEDGVVVAMFDDSE